MTEVKRISLVDMIEETGMPALGYSRPQEDEILLVDGLPKPLEKEVMAHEHDHIAAGEEGPFIGALIGAGASLFGAKKAGDAAGDAAAASERGTMAGIAENRRQFDTSTLVNLLMNMPSINTGNVARSQLAGMLGLEVPGVDYGSYAGLFNKGSGGGKSWSGNSDGTPGSDFKAWLNSKRNQASGGGGSSGLGRAFRGLEAPASQMTDPSAVIERTPGYEFVKNQGVKSIMNNSRALGLGKSGMTAGNVGEFVGNSVALPFYSDYMNRIASLAGAGTSTSANTSANIGAAATNSGAMNAGLMQNAADTRASGILGKAGAYQAGLNSIADVAGDYFGGKYGTPPINGGGAGGLFDDMGIDIGL